MYSKNQKNMKSKLINKKILITLFGLLIAVTLSSCVKIKINGKNITEYFDRVKEITKKSYENVSEQKEEEEVLDIDTDTGEKIPSLSGDVFTLSKYSLPKTDDVIAGFKVKFVFDYDRRNAKVVVFEHEKTGATAFLISNDDEDMSATIGFNTLAYDNRGIPHIFEHATLGGSEKYPSSNVFYEISNKTYNTYMNAFTMQQATVYPVTSLSDEQLFALYKVYVDGIFNPNLLKNENSFKREAYRYSLSDKNSDINLSGVAYSEMAANESNIMFASSYNAGQTLYKDSVVSFVTGGKTNDIIKLKNDDLIEFHNKYYHPSNMVITLYGNIDYKKYLEFTNDEYLKNFDKIEIDKADKLYIENSGVVEKTFDFPVSSTSEIENKSIIAYSIPCEGLSAYEAGIFSIVLSDLESSDGEIRNLLNKKLDKADFYIDYNLDLARPYINIFYTNVNPEDKDILKEITEEALKNEIKKGIQEEVLEASVDANDMQKELDRDSHGFTNEMDEFYSKTFRDNGIDLLGYFRYQKGIDDLRKRCKDGTIQKLMEKYFEDLSKVAITITKPKKGLLERKKEENNLKLKELKESMSDGEIEKLIAENNEFEKWVEENDKNSVIEKVRVASVSSLSEYRAKCYAYEENNEGVRFIRSDIDDINYSYVNILFDASSIPYEDLHKLKLLSDLLLYLPTSNYDDFKLSNEFSKVAYSYGTSLENAKYYDGGYTPYLSFSFMALNKHIDTIITLLRELMFETKFEDVQKLRNFVNQTYVEMVSNFEAEPSAYASKVIYAASKDGGMYDLYVEGVDYLKFLKEISKLDDDALKEILTDCQNILKKIYNRNGMVCEIISDFSEMSNIKSKIMNLSYEFNDERITKVDYNSYFNKEHKNVAVGCNSQVLYNYLYLPFKENDIKFSAKQYVIDSWVNNTYLYPEFRVKRSCYGASVDSSIDFMSMNTYRDPNLSESYLVMADILKFIDNNNMTHDELEDYKLNAYSYFSYPLTKLSAAYIAIDETLQKWSDKRPERYVRYMKEIKDTSLDDVQTLKELYKMLVEKGKKVTVGNFDLIERNGGLFDEIIHAFVE